MKTSSTVLSGPDYIAEASQRRFSTGQDYLASGLVYDVDHIPITIGRAMATTAPSSVAPPYQLTGVAIRQLRSFAASLEPFIALHNGWNGPLSTGPTARAVSVAISTCLSLIQAGVPSPRPKMLSDGTLGGFWSFGQAYATMDFEEDGEHLWTVTDGTSYTTGTWKTGEAVPKAVDRVAEDYLEFRPE